MTPTLVLTYDQNVVKYYAGENVLYFTELYQENLESYNYAGLERFR